MVSRILVALDGSPAAEAALLPALTVARAQGAQLMLLRAVPVHDAETVLATEDHAYRTANRYLDQVQSALAGTGLVENYLVEYGDAAEVIVTALEHTHARMLAMSTHGRTGLRRVMLGSITERVLHRAAVPLLLVRTAESREEEAAIPVAALPQVQIPLGPQRVLIPLDGSTCAEYAVHYLQEQGLLDGADVFLLRTVPSVIAGGIRSAPESVLQHVDTEAVMAAEQDLVEARLYLELLARTQLRGIRCRILPVAGYPAKRIMEIAQAEHVDLIAMVSHHRAGVSRFLTGTVTGHVLHHTSVPLLVLHHSQAANGCEAADPSRPVQIHSDPPPLVTLPSPRPEDD